MNVDATFIQKILDIAQTESFVDGDRTFYTREVFPVLAPEPEPLLCHTLSGLVDFFNALPESDRNRVMFHVQDFDTVSIISELIAPEKQRERFITSKARSQENTFNRFHPHEDFMIQLLSMFVQDDTTAEILKLLSNVKVDEGVHYSDDGLSQTITAKTGISLYKNVRFPNPVKLRPYRTFADIEQPESTFVIRQRTEGSSLVVAMFQADGSAWKNSAIESIKAYLQERVPVQIIA